MTTPPTRRPARAGLVAALLVGLLGTAGCGGDAESADPADSAPGDTAADAPSGERRGNTSGNRAGKKSGTKADGGSGVVTTPGGAAAAPAPPAAWDGPDPTEHVPAPHDGPWFVAAGPEAGLTHRDLSGPTAA